MDNENDGTSNNNSIPALTTLDIDELLKPLTDPTFTLTSTYGGYSSNTASSYTFSTSSYVYNITGMGNSAITNSWAGSTPPAFNVKGNAVFDEDVIVRGYSILEFMQKIQDRLAILQVDPKKLEKYEALKKAYDHYKILEKLIGDDDEQKE